MNYIDELMSLGYLKCCAVRMTNCMIQQGKEDELIAKIEREKSIKEHVAEVLG